MDLLLTHGHFLCDDPKEQHIMKPYAPLGLLYLSSYLRKKGFDVEVYDATFGSSEELFGILKTGPASTIGIYANLMTRPSVVRIIECARNEGWTVIVGGPEPSQYVREYLEAGADLVVEGEGEITIGEVLTAFRHKAASLQNIAGVIFRSPDNSSGENTQRVRLVGELDSLPWPDREKIRVEDYLKAWRNRHGAGSLSLVTARGCPYQCRWCSRSTFGDTHRRRSVNDVANEVEWLLRPLSSRHAVDRRRRLHHQRRMDISVCERDEAQGIARSFRMSHPGGSNQCADLECAGRVGLFSDLDRM